LSLVVKIAVASTRIFVSLVFENDSVGNLYWKEFFWIILVIHLVGYFFLFVGASKYLIQTTQILTKNGQHLDFSDVSSLLKIKLLIFVDIIDATIIFCMTLILIKSRL
jgi:hypothetical protein